MKLLFEIIFIFEAFYCEKEIQKNFLIKLKKSDFWPFEYHRKHKFPM